MTNDEMILRLTLIGYKVKKHRLAIFIHPELPKIQLRTLHPHFANRNVTGQIWVFGEKGTRGAYTFNDFMAKVV